MAKMAKSGGGINSRQVRNVREGTREKPAVHGTNVAYAGNLGRARGTHVMEDGELKLKPEPMYRGPSFQPVRFGNQMTVDPKPGPGSGRTVMKSGSQSQYGSPNPGMAPAKNRDILSEFGPDKMGMKR